MNILTHTLPFLLLFFSFQVHAETAPVQAGCKNFDFDSYSKVRTIKDSILKNYPDRSKPNFAGHYFLIKNDYLMETQWYVVDCLNGKFVRTSLSSDSREVVGQFRVDSDILILTEKHRFENEKWNRITSTDSKNDLQFSNYPPKEKSEACKPLDFDSHSRAQNAKKTIIDGNPDLSRPNFSGHFLLLKVETLFQDYWLLADCKTGQFFSEVITQEISFKPESSLVKRYDSGKPLSYLLWSEEEQQFFQLSGENKIYGKSAKLLFDAIPNPDHSSTLRFERLKCAAANCEVEQYQKPITQIAPQHLEGLQKIFKMLGQPESIKNGKCIQDQGRMNCVLEI